MTRDDARPTDEPTATVRGRRLTHLLPLSRADAPWLGVGLAAGLVVVAVYLLTNPYPAYGAGLYVQMATEILAHGYALPAQVPGYTAEGVPFAYPPLCFYVLAVLLDVGVDPVILVRFLPSAAMLVALVPTYLLGRDYAASRPAGAAASVAVAVNPQLVQWHLSAGGVVRAFAFLYAVTAVYAGYHAFETGGWQTVAVGLVAFAATLLTHPTYTLFVVVSYLLLWAIRDRSTAGFARGAVVGFGGIALATPWLAWVATTHGPAVFLAASGTHGGVGGGIETLDDATFTLLPLVGAAYLLVARGDRFIAAWAAAAELLFSQPRFAFTVGAVVVGSVAVDVAGRLRSLDGTVARIDRRAALAATCLVVAAAGGGTYLAHEMTLSGDPSSPEFLDDEAVGAMAWIEAETRPDATFVVLGDAAEWHPALTGRTLLVGPWGVEWRGPERYGRQMEAYETVSQCTSVDCVESAGATVGASPDYVYLPKGQYTVSGESVAEFGTLGRSFERSPQWERAYENDGVVIYRAVPATRSRTVPPRA